MESCQWAWSPVGGHGTSPSFVRQSPNDSLGARDESEAMKRFQSSVLTAVMLMSMLSFGLSNAAAESPEIVIDSAVEWVDDDSIDTIVRIVDGGYPSTILTMVSIESSSTHPTAESLSLIYFIEPTRLERISHAVFCLTKQTIPYTISYP